MNILHDIKAIAGEKDDIINVIIEIQKGSKNKYELDKETGLIKLDRVMKTSQDYPFDYGFVPQTHWHDGDPQSDVIAFVGPEPARRAVLFDDLIPVRGIIEPIGLVRMDERLERCRKHELGRLVELRLFAVMTDCMKAPG